MIGFVQNILIGDNLSKKKDAANDYTCTGERDDYYGDMSERMLRTTKAKGYGGYEDKEKIVIGFKASLRDDHRRMIQTILVFHIIKGLTAGTDNPDYLVHLLYYSLDGKLQIWQSKNRERPGGIVRELGYIQKQYIRNIMHGNQRRGLYILLNNFRGFENGGGSIIGPAAQLLPKR